ncbi:Uncharacterised protein [Staphylococcus aureus]|nr:Uncharacterised protein [Staphylococcus aureus]
MTLPKVAEIPKISTVLITCMLAMIVPIATHAIKPCLPKKRYISTISTNVAINVTSPKISLYILKCPPKF